MEPAPVVAPDAGEPVEPGLRCRFRRQRRNECGPLRQQHGALPRLVEEGKLDQPGCRQLPENHHEGARPIGSERFERKVPQGGRMRAPRQAIEHGGVRLLPGQEPHHPAVRLPHREGHPVAGPLQATTPEQPAVDSRRSRQIEEAHELARVSRQPSIPGSPGFGAVYLKVLRSPTLRCRGQPYQGLRWRIRYTSEAAEVAPCAAAHVCAAAQRSAPRRAGGAEAGRETARARQLAWLRQALDALPEDLRTTAILVCDDGSFQTSPGRTPRQMSRRARRRR